MDKNEIIEEIEKIINQHQEEKQAYSRYGSAGGPMAVGSICDDLEQLKEKLQEADSNG